MKEIKFRAWDKEFKRFSENVLNHTIADINFHTDYEWMQYTGLKDKNGKEIYEGDILNCRTLIIKTMKWSELQEVIEDIIQVYYFINYDELEVIGNIYENPELLGDSQ
ncbi:YopX family protein [Lysinibacillus fusiformis]